LRQEPVSTTRAALDELKRRHVEFLSSRLTSEQAKGEWRTNVAAILDELTQAPLGRVVDAEALEKVLDVALSKAIFDDAVRPAVDKIAKDVSAELTREKAPLGTFVSEQAQKSLADFFARPDLIPPKLLREITEHEAAREVMRDILYDALKQFSERSNPFVAEWGLPSLLKKLGPFGGGVGKSIDSVRIEFERRLDPEIRKFLVGFSRTALEDTTTSIIARADTPSFIALRRRLASFFLEQRFAELLPNAEGLAQATRVGLDIAGHLGSNETLAAKRRAFLQGFVSTHQHKPVGEVLASLGLPAKPPSALVTALAEATFPAFVSAIQSPSAQRWLASVAADFYDNLVASDEA